MSALLVMSPAGADWSEWLPLLFPRCELLAQDPLDACSAVIVINDRSAAAAQLLHRALDLRQARPQLPVAVLTPVPDAAPAIEALVRALAPPQASVELPAAQVLAAVAAEALPARVRIDSQSISFEFDA